MRELVARYLSQGISRRGFVGGLTKGRVDGGRRPVGIDCRRRGELGAKLCPRRRIGSGCSADSALDG